MMNRRYGALALCTLALAGCVSVPQGPTVAVMPGTSKSLDQFQSDNGNCQQYAQSAIAGPTRAAYDQAGANLIGSVALGALIGAAFGSVTGDAGYGAAWGAGTGAMFGSAGAGNAGAASSYTLQQQYNAAYMQCMYTHGNQVPGRVVQRRYSTTVPGYAPRVYPVPADATAAPRGTPPPAVYRVPSDAIAPPPGTPAPQ
jgi:hypothetical protein